MVNQQQKAVTRRKPSTLGSFGCTSAKRSQRTTIFEDETAANVQLQRKPWALCRASRVVASRLNLDAFCYVHRTMYNLHLVCVLMRGRLLCSKSVTEGGYKEETFNTWLLWRASRVVASRLNKTHHNIWIWNCRTLECVTTTTTSKVKTMKLTTMVTMVDVSVVRSLNNSWLILVNFFFNGNRRTQNVAKQLRYIST